jgi:hypothetical protein
MACSSFFDIFSKSTLAHVSWRSPLIASLNYFAQSLITRPNGTFKRSLNVEAKITSLVLPFHDLGFCTQLFFHEQVFSINSCCILKKSIHVRTYMTGGSNNNSPLFRVICKVYFWLKSNKLYSFFTNDLNHTGLCILLFHIDDISQCGVLTCCK